ncbi:hypothetical protein [Polaromonas naphthalenivorans]|uniref:Uncharacterized protein n=1 Tax=Polaromonas naphthalenivorans (strain CJ2) TaxID=365044 RepID=A1VPK0_POLNA|nr:hypothetical protein [Polaromonas naphthalenivorans]ABM37578.1 hypothetical protein Pnap_2270 [Polaromonas naphthalenivorans CJ2]
MSRHSTTSLLSASTWSLVCALAIIMASSWLIDGPSETQAAQDVADEAEYAAAQADGGAAKCAALGRTPIWTPDGNLICRAAAKPVTVAQGGRP